MTITDRRHFNWQGRLIVLGLVALVIATVVGFTSPRQPPRVPRVTVVSNDKAPVGAPLAHMRARLALAEAELAVMRGRLGRTSVRFGRMDRRLGRMDCRIARMHRPLLSART